MLIKKINISNKEVFPIVEGGKGINISTGITAGNFAKNNCVGTFSATNADSYDENGNVIRQRYESNLTRLEKFQKLIDYAIKGAVAQAKIAHDISGGLGAIHMNVLWEAGGTEKIIDSVLEKTKGLIHGVTSGAGLPYKIAEIASKHGVYYYPIVSSDRAFSVLWRRSFYKFSELLGGVVYEDPWLAGGHNGISNNDNPNSPEDCYLRVHKIRKIMSSFGLDHIPIIIAGGVWFLREWKNFIDNKEIGLVAFQYGTRPLVTVESPISDECKKNFLNIKKGNVILNQFSPTGFYSSAIKNKFLKNLELRSQRQIEASRTQDQEFNIFIPSQLNSQRGFYIREKDNKNVQSWIEQGFNTLMKTPDNTIIFETPEMADQIKTDQQNCMGCLSACRFSSWSQHNPNHTTGALPDPRSFCIQKTLQDIGHQGSYENNLVFSGHNVYKFSQDPLYKDGYIPTIAELIENIKEGN